MQLGLLLGMVQQAVDVQRKFRYGSQGEGIGLARQFEQRAQNAVDGILVIADQLQMAQAFFRSGQKAFRFNEKLR